MHAVRLSWRLVFSFVVGGAGEEVELLQWTLPILVLPTNPITLPNSIQTHTVLV